jgi:hypothetical protein
LHLPRGAFAGGCLFPVDTEAAQVINVIAHRNQDAR